MLTYDNVYLLLLTPKGFKQLRETTRVKINK